MLIGGIWVDEITYNRVIAECKRFKQENGWSETTKFNWKNLSKKTLLQYCKFIDIFFKYNLQFIQILKLSLEELDNIINSWKFDSLIQNLNNEI